MAFQWYTLPDGRVIVNGLELWPSDAAATMMSEKVIGPWRSIAEQVADESGVPAAWILGVIGAESEGNQNAGSSAGAVGLMQLLPRYHFPPNTNWAYWTDPLNNIRAGAKYLASFRAKGYDLPTSAAAYNVGHLVKNNSDWGMYAEGCPPTVTPLRPYCYISKVVEYANYAYEAIANNPSTSYRAPAMIFAAGAALLGWHAYKTGSLKALAKRIGIR